MESINENKSSKPLTSTNNHRQKLLKPRLSNNKLSASKSAVRRSIKLLNNNNSQLKSRFHYQCCRPKQTSEAPVIEKYQLQQILSARKLTTATTTPRMNQQQPTIASASKQVTLKAHQTPNLNNDMKKTAILNRHAQTVAASTKMPASTTPFSSSNVITKSLGVAGKSNFQDRYKQSPYSSPSIHATNKAARQATAAVQSSATMATISSMARSNASSKSTPTASRAAVTAKTPSFRNTPAVSSKTPSTLARSNSNKQKKQERIANRTPIQKLNKQFNDTKKRVSQTVGHARSSVRRSIRMLTGLSRNLFNSPSNRAGKTSSSKIPVYTGSLRRYPQTDSKVTKTVSYLQQEEQENLTRKSIKSASKRRSSRFAFGDIESSCLLITPKVMRQLFAAKEKKIAEEEAEEEQPIKVHAIKPSSLMKYLFSDTDKKEEAMKMLSNMVNNQEQLETIIETKSSQPIQEEQATAVAVEIKSKIDEMVEATVLSAVSQTENVVMDDVIENVVSESSVQLTEQQQPTTLDSFQPAIEDSLPNQAETSVVNEISHPIEQIEAEHVAEHEAATVFQELPQTVAKEMATAPIVEEEVKTDETIKETPTAEQIEQKVDQDAVEEAQDELVIGCAIESIPIEVEKANQEQLMEPEPVQEPEKIVEEPSTTQIESVVSQTISAVTEDAYEDKLMEPEQEQIAEVSVVNTESEKETQIEEAAVAEEQIIEEAKEAVAEDESTEKELEPISNIPASEPDVSTETTPVAAAETEKVADEQIINPEQQKENDEISIVSAEPEKQTEIEEAAVVKEMEQEKEPEQEETEMVNLCECEIQTTFVEPQHLNEQKENKMETIHEVESSKQLDSNILKASNKLNQSFSDQTDSTSKNITVENAAYTAALTTTSTSTTSTTTNQNETEQNAENIDLTKKPKRGGGRKKKSEMQQIAEQEIVKSAPVPPAQQVEERVLTRAQRAKLNQKIN